MATYKENLILSQICYNDFTEFLNKKTNEIITIENLLKKEDSSLNKYLSKKENVIWQKHFESIKDWKIINYWPNTKSGFSATAFMSPQGEIVIAFRGTEPNELLRFFQDVKIDAKIATAWDAQLIVQFEDAKRFVCETLNVKSLKDLPPNTKLSFTGHSLGGGLAQYLAYETMGRNFETTTFNAVGVAQCLSKEALLADYSNIKNYNDIWDIIANYGIHLGEKIYKKNNQQLDSPMYPAMRSNFDYSQNLGYYFEDLWNSGVYKIDRNIENIRDYFRQKLNFILAGVPYSHSPINFIDSCNQDGQFNEKYRATESEVEFAQSISRIVYLYKMGKKEVGATIEALTEKAKDWLDSAYKTVTGKGKRETQQKSDEKKKETGQSETIKSEQKQGKVKQQTVNSINSNPISSSKELEGSEKSRNTVTGQNKTENDNFHWPKWFHEEHQPVNYVALAKQMKWNNFGKSLGYEGFEQLKTNSKHCAEHNGINFYITEDIKTGKIILWNDQSCNSFAEFPNRQAWNTIANSEQLQTIIQQEITKINGNQMSKSQAIISTPGNSTISKSITFNKQQKTSGIWGHAVPNCLII